MCSMWMVSESYGDLKAITKYGENDQTDGIVSVIDVNGMSINTKLNIKSISITKDLGKSPIDSKVINLDNLAKATHTDLDKNTVNRAQQLIKGVVVDEVTGLPLQGATVSMRINNDQKVQTNSNGEFELVYKGEDIILVSYMGYQSFELSVKNAIQNLYIKLIANSSELGEVVVVGYGTQKKENLTGSVSAIKGDEIAERPVSNSMLALQGMAPGLSIVNRGGAPGDDNVQVKIRGTGTLNNSNPLVLVDGIPQSLSSVSPGEIESISVLKDAASAAIYGSRAGNGVILVTTKRGVKEGVVVSYDNYFGIQRKNFWPKSASPGDYLRLTNEAFENAGLAAPHSDEWISNVEAGTEPLKYPFTDWTKALFNDHAFQHSHSVNLSTGGKSGRIMASLNYLDQDGILNKHNFERYSARINADLNISEKLSFSADLLYRRKNYTGVGQGPNVLIQSVLHSKQSVVGTYPNGAHDLVGGWINTYALVEKSGSDKRITDEVVGTLGLKYDILDGLSLKGYMSFNNSFGERQLFQKRLEMLDYYTGQPIPVGSMWAQNKLTDSRSRTFEPNYRVFADYTKDIGKSNFKILLGYDEIHNRYRSISAYRDNFYSNDLQEIDAGDSKNWRNSGGSSEWRLRSFFGRMNYAFDNKYLFEANVRYDGSSRFSKGKKFGTFPSFSAGWRLGQEDFLKDSELISELKLRTSWGKLGNQDIPLYRNVATYSLEQGYNFNDQIVVGAAQILAANPDITWETTTMSNIGVDLELFKGKFSVIGEYFWRNTKDILFSLPIPPSIGIEAPTQNSASVENKGWELSLRYNSSNYESPFKYSIGFNISDVINKITDLKGTGPYYRDNFITWREGYSINTLYGYKTLGLYRTQDDLNNYPKINDQASLGDIIYADTNNDGIITPADRVVIGNMDPRFPIGLDFNASYKGFDFSMFWQGVLKAQSNLDGALIEGPDWQNYTTADMAKERYHETRNPNGTMPKVTYGNSWNIYVSDFWLQDTKYVRLKNVQLGYTLPSSVLEKVKIKKLRVYLSGENLVTFTSARWVDPEFPAGRLQYFPQSKVMTAGMNFIF